MKGSGNDQYSGRVNLSYRTKKLTVNNNLTINGYNANNSPYGSFSTWVNTNPYYRKESSDAMYLFSFTDPAYMTIRLVSNPLYNANLNSFNKSSRWGITDNFQLTYNINQYWRVQGTAQLTASTSQSNIFVSPLHTNYADVNYLLKGQYNYSGGKGLSYTGTAMLSYGQNFHKHFVNFNARTEVSNNENSSTSFMAVGFPASSTGKLSQAYSFATNSKPGYAKAITRRNSIVASFSYSYDQRYNVDLTFNMDGSTAFGQNNVYSPFYSIGGSWNVKNEKFLKDVEWISMLRLRANFGITGNQNFASYTSTTTYQYLNKYNYSGVGAIILSLGNPNLEWQSTYQTSFGLDASLMKGRLTLNLNGYRKLTDPLAVSVLIPPSTGLSTTPLNAGKLDNKGVDGTISFAPIYKRDKDITWFIRLTGSRYTQKYKDFGSSLSSLNDTLQRLGSLVRYTDGYAPDDMWAVVSLGIDPATGQEIFLKKDGVTRTFTYSASDIVKVGNSRPSLQGTIGNNLNYKGFTMSVNCRYIWHQSIMNSALYEKVENISLTEAVNNNQDARALYERWKKAGDLAQFKSISVTSKTSMSSRFIQEENRFTLESLSVGYNFGNTKFIKESHVFSNIRLTGYMNDIMYLSTVKRERGIDYPYAKSFSLSLNANFK
jgi:hypothetical protein